MNDLFIEIEPDDPNAEPTLVRVDEIAIVFPLHKKHGAAIVLRSGHVHHVDEFVGDIQQKIAEALHGRGERTSGSIG